MNRILLAALATSLFSFGCTPLESNDPDDSAVAGMFKSSAAGTWATGCDDYVENGNNRSRVKKLVLRENEASMSEFIFGNLNCQGTAIDSSTYDAWMKVIEEPLSEKEAVVEFENKSPADYHFYRQKTRLELVNQSLKATVLGMSTRVDGNEVWLEENDFSADKYSEYGRPSTTVLGMN